MDNENFCRMVNGQLLTEDSTTPASTLASYAAEQFEGMVSSRFYPCIGARTAHSKAAFRFGFYGSNKGHENGKLITEALAKFEEQRNDDNAVFASYIAIFTEWKPSHETEFEVSLWNILQQIHDYDYSANNSWDSSASKDPMDPSFGFSVGGKAYFIVALHPHSSRHARRFKWPTLVFNAHSQFAALRDAKKFEPMKQKIRNRDCDLQGNANPQMVGSKEVTEAKQYSGRDSDVDWKCPFHNHHID